MKDPGNPKIHELNHRIALCTQKDVVVNGQTMELRRTEVVWCWARVKSHYGLPFVIGQMGYTISDLTTKATHAITIRNGLVDNVTDTAYVYEEFRKSAPRWYKVLGISEPERFIVMTTRLIEVSDMATPPQSVLAPQPSRVDL
jgi:pheromone shutdown protein TraB